MKSAPWDTWWRRWRMQKMWLSLKAILVLAKPILWKTTAQTTSTWKCRRPLSGNNSAILSYFPLLQWHWRYFAGLVSLFTKRSLLVLFSSDQLSNFSSARAHTHTDAQFLVSIDNEEEGIGTGSHAHWRAWGRKANYSLFLTITSDVILFAVKALTGYTLNILAICPIGFCSSQLKPFKDSAACHFRADWLPNAHIWNT